MDLQRIRDSLTPQQQAAIDLDAAWRRFRSNGGLDEDDVFESWLAEQYPQLFDLHRTLIDAPVEVSMVLPSRFAKIAANVPADDARTFAETEAPTVLSGRSERAPVAA